MFAHIVTTYDVKLEIEGVRPPDMLVMTTCVPNSSPKTSKHLDCVAGTTTSLAKFGDVCSSFPVGT